MREINYDIREREFIVAEPNHQGGRIVLRTKCEARAYRVAGLMDEYLMILRRRAKL